MTTASSPLLQLGARSARSPVPATTLPILESGFRTFFFLAALSAVLLVPTWLVVLSSGSVLPYWSPTLWHGHEMIFGFTIAVIAGFLITAGSNWTGRDVASGRLLLALGGLWLAGRVAPFLEVLPGQVVAALDLSFLPVMGAVLARSLIKSGNKRNFFFLFLLAGLATANVMYHLENAGNLDLAGRGRDLSLRIVALMVLVIGGRIFPMFTRNATRVNTIQNVPALDKLALGFAVFTILLELTPIPEVLLGLAWIVTGLLNVLRMVSWGSSKASAPLLWVLHAGYFAAAASFVLQGLFLLGVVPQSAALHCFTVGCVGLLTLGMMVRVSLGHSGRLLVAPKSMALSFWLLALAALVRIGGSFGIAGLVVPSWHLAGTLWTVSFALLLWFGVPIWFRPRVDA